MGRVPALADHRDGARVNLRDALNVLGGVSGRDLRDAVKQSRELVRNVQGTADLIAAGLRELAPRLPGKVGVHAAKASDLAARVARGAGSMLERR